MYRFQFVKELALNFKERPFLYIVYYSPLSSLVREPPGKMRARERGAGHGPVGEFSVCMNFLRQSSERVIGCGTNDCASTHPYRMGWCEQFLKTRCNNRAPAGPG